MLGNDSLIAAKESQIPAALSSLDKVLTRVRILVDEVESRLVTVLQPDPPQSACPTEAVDRREGKVAVAARVVDFEYQLERIAERLAGLIDRLEV